MSNRTRQRWDRYNLLAYCCASWGISAVLGGVALVAGILPIPDSLLDGSPFPDYTIPGLALTAVGIGSLLCGIALPKRQRRTVLVAGALGIAQMVFLGVELIVIGFSGLLAIYAVIALATILLAWRIATDHDAPARRTGSAEPPQRASS
ncbi:MAG: hypothetical protein QM753_03495 [Thermomicrobiales bacterium]